MTDGGTIGQILGAQMGGIAIDDEQSAFTSPLTQAQWQELVFCPIAKPDVKTTKRKTKRFIFFSIPKISLSKLSKQ